LILEGFDRGYVTKEERDKGMELSRRTIAALVRFRLYLLSSETPPLKPKVPECRTPAPKAPAP
jgi:hypothetical protein